jgi:hypothetical protein
MRYRFRLAGPLSYGGETLDLELGGRPATLKARKGGPLLKTRDVVLLSGGFETEAAARAFGQRVRHALLTTSVAAQLGIDVGDDRPTTNIASHVKERVLEQCGAALLDDVHGLMVYHEEPTPRIQVGATVTVTITSPLEKFLSALKTSFDGAAKLPANLESAIELYCASRMETSQIARLILALSAIEAMVGEELRLRPAVELELLERALEAVRQAKSSRNSRNAVLGAIGKLRKLGDRRAGQNLVEAYLPGEGTTFVEVNKHRGKMAHKHGRADRAKAAQSAHAASQLAARLIAPILQNDSQIREPS